MDDNKELTKSQRTNLRRKSRSEEQIEKDKKRLRPTGRKQCSKCHKDYPLEAYTRDVYRADGLNSMCSACWAKTRMG